MIKASLNVRVIEDAINGNFLREVAVYVKLKSLFSNSCIYGATYKKLSKVSGISLSVLKECVPFFKEKGWIRVHSGNMVFVSNWNLDHKREELKQVFKFKVSKCDSYKIILKRLKVLLVKGISEKFEHCKKMWHDYNHAKNGIDLKKARRAFRKYMNINFPICENARFTMSNKKIGSLFNRSKSTGSRLMKWANKDRMCRVEVNFNLVDKIKHPGCMFGLLKDKHSGMFFAEGFLFRRFPNFINF